MSRHVQYIDNYIIRNRRKNVSLKTIKNKIKKRVKKRGEKNHWKVTRHQQQVSNVKYFFIMHVIN